MEALGILEKKLADLVELAKKFKDQNSKLEENNKFLQEENAQLKDQILSFEEALLKNSENLSEEKELTKMVVDGLIKSIDTLIENEPA